MSPYFCDSSGLVKRYVNEAGTAWITGIMDPAAGNTVHVVRLVEPLDGVNAKRNRCHGQAQAKETGPSQKATRVHGRAAPSANQAQKSGMSCWNWPRRTAVFFGSSPPSLTWLRHQTNW